jgi:nitrite reductase (NO-forming)
MTDDVQRDTAPESDAVVPTTLQATLVERTSRRRFIVEAGMLAGTLAACGRPEHGAQRPDTAHAAARPGERGAEGPHVQNPDSRLDTALHHPHTGNSVTGEHGGVSAVPFHVFDAALPPLAKERTTRLHFTAEEAPIRIRDDLVVAGWTFNGDIPGPILHVRQGDTVEFTLTNKGQVPHSMDFHAAQINPKEAFKSVVQGGSLTYSFKPKYAGAFMYHCGTSPVLMHIGSGMFGVMVVDPPQPLRKAREFVLIQNELYLGTATNGLTPFDYTKMLSNLPDLLAFNGRPEQYQTAPLRAKRGELVRFYVVNAGPTAPCSFHIVGEQFDTVYLGAPPGNAIHGVQTFNVPAGAGMIFELQADIVGEFVFVNHAFGHGQKGAIGTLIVEE